MIDTIAIVVPLMLSPGPANLVSFLLGTRNSVPRLLPFQLGILLVYAIVAIALGFLTKQLSDFSPIAISSLQALGGLFIIYLGIQLALRTKREAKERSPTFLNGVTLQCLNPKYPGVVLAVFANRNSQPILMTVAIICIVGAFALILYSTAGSLLRASHEPDKRFGMVDFVAGVLLCAVGLWFIFQSLVGA